MLRKATALLRIASVLAIAVAASGAGGPATGAPLVTAHHKITGWRIFRPPLHGPYSDIKVGPDGEMWIASTGAQALLGLDEYGKSRRLPMDFDATTLTAGGDGRIYMTQHLPELEIGAIATGGKLSVYFKGSSPSNDVFYDTALALGADGNVWFGEFQHFANVSPKGAITEIPYVYGENDNGGVSLFATKTRMYYTVCCQGQTFTNSGFVGYYDFPSRTLNEYPLTPEACDGMAGVGIAGDGNLYVLCSGGGFGPSEIVRVDGFGNVRETYPYYGPIYTAADAMVIGPDGNIWFAPGTGGVLVRFDIARKAFDQYFTPDGSSPTALTVGRDGNLWAVAASSVDVFLIRHALRSYDH